MYFYLPPLPVNIPQEKIREFCQRHYICKLSLFGSVLREDFTEESDVDFLVEFEPGKTPGFFKMAQMERELSEIIDGRQVDLRTPPELSPYFRDRVMQEAEVIYDVSGRFNAPESHERCSNGSFRVC